MRIWTGLLEALGEVLRLFHDATVGLFGEYAWLAAIVLLTLTVRLALMPLAIRQFRSMQAMQKLRPEMQKIQKKYKADRSMMRTDPEKYREKRQKQQEELMALYKEHNVNPASSCLPLVAQMPIFIALFSMLRSPDIIPELADATFVGTATLQQNISSMLAANATAAATVGIVMLVGMGFTTFVQQKQMMGRQAVAPDDQQMQQQKIMMYVMPVFLAVLGWGLPVGILVYWVTTNLLQMAQQWFMLREVDHTATAPTNGGSGAAGSIKDSGATSQSRDPKSGPAGKPPTSGKSGKSTNAGRSGNAGGTKKPTSGKDSGKANRNGAHGNGHRPGGPGRLGRKGDETRDKRR